MDGWMDGWMDGQIDRQIDRYDKKIGIAGGVVHTTITRKMRSTDSKCTIQN